jgi:DNA (cytosine-5)-methyltransferase 1|nr:MAG TPA: Cytosine specific methyltransferase [Caudoviricetes sp.]
MKFIDFFAGIGGFRRGMELAGHECVGFCEFDKFATASYISMHLLTEEQRKTLEDIPIKKRQKEILKEEYRNGEWYANDIRRVYAGDIPKADCWCFGFPCQDISVAGKQAGFQGNRSSLFFRVMYLVGQLKEEDKPTYLFIENVKNLLSVNGGWDFARLLIEMDRAGYDAEWQVLNSKDFGVPQSRERCFIIGHLRGRSTSKIFPIEGTDEKNSVSLNLFSCLNGRNSQRDRVYSDDGLAPTISTKPGGNTEPKVSIKIIGEISSSQDGKILSTDGIANCHSAGHGNNPKIAIPVLTPDRAEKRQNGRRFKDNGEPMFTLTRADIHGVAIEPTGFNCMPDGTCRTLKNQYQKNSGVNFACQTDRGATAVAVKFKNITASTIRKVAPRNKVSILRGQSQENNLDICVKVAEATKQGYSECRVGVDAVNLSVPGSKTRRGRVGKEIANTLDTSCNQGIFVQVSEELVVYAVWYEKYQCYIAIRKLTPKECFRLQGWSDDYFEKAQFVNSDSQLYKQAGNGVTVTVIEAIARKMNVNLN